MLIIIFKVIKMKLITINEWLMNKKHRQKNKLYTTNKILTNHKKTITNKFVEYVKILRIMRIYVEHNLVFVLRFHILNKILE